MRRIGGILFLLLLTACEPEAAGTTVEAETISVEQVTTTSSTSTSTPTSTSTSAPPPTTTSTTVARPTTTATPARVTVATTVPVTRAAPTTSTTAPAAAGGCDPNYAGCVPIASDVDCGGGSGNGPAYVYAKNIRVIGRDIYGLDADGDGVGCES